MKNQMSKKSYSKNSNRENEYPTVVDMDTLSYMNDEDLGKLHVSLHAEKDRMPKSEDALAAWEKEICYVQRELKIRADRRNEHEQYLRSNPQDNYYEDDHLVDEEFDSIMN